MSLSVDFQPERQSEIYVLLSDSMSVGALFVLGLAVTVGAGLLLYLLADRETESRPTMERSRAERVARRDHEERERDRR